MKMRKGKRRRGSRKDDRMKIGGEIERESGRKWEEEVVVTERKKGKGNKW